MNLPICLLITILFCGFAEGQSAEESTVPAPKVEEPVNQKGKVQIAPDQPVEDKRAYGVMPNYRTAEGLAPFHPLTTKQKFTIAFKDSFDGPVFGTTAMWAGLSQLQGTNDNVYGQGLKGFAHRYGINYADQVIGNYYPEAIIPALMHKDPRYFRKGDGSGWSRLYYAINRIVVSKNDNGVTTFNSPEILGNALASVTVMSYHPHERTLRAGLYQWGVTYMGSDMVGQILKEFWPDFKRRVLHKRDDGSQ
jgi:hypothetical protein